MTNNQVNKKFDLEDRSLEFAAQYNPELGQSTSVLADESSEFTKIFSAIVSKNN